MGENIAWWQDNNAHAVSCLAASPGYNETMLTSFYTKIGIGYYTDANGYKDWVQSFSD